MLRPRILISLLVVATLLLAAFTTPSLGASTDYDIHVDGAVDTVDRPVSTSYGEFVVTEIGRANADDSVTISIDAPTDATYTITVVDNEQRIRRSRTVTGDVTTTFDTDGLSTGTYAVAVGNQSTDEVYEMEPLVVKAYDVMTKSDNTATERNALDVTVELDQVGSGESVDVVQLVLADDSNTERVDATKVNDSTYTATVPTDEVGTGDYSLYAVVRSDDTALGEKELVGVSDERTIEVVEATTDSETTDSSGSTDGESSTGGSDSSDTTTETTTAETETEITKATTVTETESTTTAPTTTETTTTTPTSTATTTTDSVLTPNEQTTTQAQTTSSELPNTALQALFGLLVVFGVGRRIVRD